MRPRIVPTPNDSLSGGESWLVDGTYIGKARNVGHDTSREAREMEDIKARLKHMDELDIDIQVLYPTMFIEQISDKPAWEIAISKGYNRWLADIWQQGEGRLRWICVLPLLDMPASLEELKFCKQNGAVGVFMRGIEGSRMITDPYFYPLYDAMSRLDMAVGVHVGNGSPQNIDMVSQYNGGGSFCGYHNSTVYQGKSVAYGVMPDLTGGSCSFGCGGTGTECRRRSSAPTVTFSSNVRALSFPCPIRSPL